MAFLEEFVHEECRASDCSGHFVGIMVPAVDDGFVVQGAQGSGAQLSGLGLLHRLLGPMGQYTACINTESIFCQAPSTYHFRALFDKMFSMILKLKQLLLFFRLTFVASMF